MVYYTVLALALEAAVLGDVDLGAAEVGGAESAEGGDDGGVVVLGGDAAGGVGAGAFHGVLAEEDVAPAHGGAVGFALGLEPGDLGGLIGGGRVSGIQEPFVAEFDVGHADTRGVSMCSLTGSGLL